MGRGRRRTVFGWQIIGGDVAALCPAVWRLSRRVGVAWSRLCVLLCFIKTRSARKPRPGWVIKKLE